MNVADAMTPREDVVTVDLPGTRTDVLEYLQERSFSSVPVVEETDDGLKYRGLISRETLIERPDEDQLVILMNEDVPTTTAETSLANVARTMVEAGARRVPVVDGQFEGIVTVTDVIHAIATGDQATDGTVESHASENVNTTYEGAPLPVAERELSYANVPYTIALDDEGRMNGVLTEVDIIDVARIVEGEEETGDNFGDQDDDWSWGDQGRRQPLSPHAGYRDSDGAGPRVHERRHRDGLGPDDDSGGYTADDQQRYRTDSDGLGRGPRRHRLRCRSSGGAI